MKAFRAPGYVEGTFGLECLLDELAAKLGVDPLELRRRNHADTDPGDGSEYSSKNLLECYRRAEPHWERRHEVRARSTATVKRGVGMASQIWFGGGGPPSYAWIRVGSNGHAAVVTATPGRRHRHEDGARPDRGRGARHPARARHGRRRRLSARAVLDPLGRLVDDAVDGARGRAPPPADARRQILELAAQRYGADAGELDARRRVDRASPTAARAARGARSACSATARSSAPARAGRTRPGCRC